MGRGRAGGVRDTAFERRGALRPGMAGQERSYERVYRDLSVRGSHLQRPADRDPERQRLDRRGRTPGTADKVIAGLWFAGTALRFFFAFLVCLFFLCFFLCAGWYCPPWPGRPVRAAHAIGLALCLLRLCET